jgi:hypothetical protein
MWPVLSIWFIQVVSFTQTTQTEQINQTDPITVFLDSHPTAINQELQHFFSCSIAA